MQWQGRHGEGMPSNTEPKLKAALSAPHYQTCGPLTDLSAHVGHPVNKQGRLKEAVARWFFQQLIIGADYCHKRGVANRDIKLENTLLQVLAMLRRGRGWSRSPFVLRRDPPAWRVHRTAYQRSRLPCGHPRRARWVGCDAVRARVRGRVGGRLPECEPGGRDGHACNATLGRPALLGPTIGCFTLGWTVQSPVGKERDC
eukprot:190899-Chlamydomonas_euryale.AAC.6